MLIKTGVGFLLVMVSLPLSLPMFAAADCTQLKGCERKFCEIEQQLTYAREHNNKKQIAGLTRSLENSKKHCTNQLLKDDLLKEIADIKSDIADYEADLAGAEKSGKPAKAAKYKDKIAAKQADLHRLEKELSDLD